MRSRGVLPRDEEAVERLLRLGEVLRKAHAFGRAELRETGHDTRVCEGGGGGGGNLLHIRLPRRTYFHGGP